MKNTIRLNFQFSYQGYYNKGVYIEGGI